MTRKAKVLTCSVLAGGVFGSGLGYFSSTAEHFPAIIPITAVLFAILGFGVGVAIWVLTRTPEERDEVQQREIEHQKIREERAASGQAGILGGLLMMLIAAAWLVIGLMNGYFYFYPPVLFLIGLFAFGKGLFNRGS